MAICQESNRQYWSKLACAVCVCHTS